MPSKNQYTTKDTAGFEVKAGDLVTIAFQAEVRSVSRDGTVILRCLNNGVTSFYPEYQAMHKIHNPNLNMHDPESGED